MSNHRTVLLAVLATVIAVFIVLYLLGSLLLAFGVSGIAAYRFISTFISFAYEDLDLVNLLRGKAKNRYSDLDFSDRSIHEPFDSKNAEYIRRGIREHIRQASVTLVFISENTSNSKWVDWEIRAKNS